MLHPGVVDGLTASLAGRESGDSRERPTTISDSDSVISSRPVWGRLFPESQPADRSRFIHCRSRLTTHTKFLLRCFMPRWPACPKSNHPGMKICPRCEVDKSLENFSKNKRNGDGKYSWCKACASREDRARYPSTRTSIEVRARSLLNGARQRLPEGFSLTLDFVVRGIERGTCPVTGINFDIDGKYKGSRHRSPYSPSLDKIDPDKGYTEENTRIVIWQYNSFKGELADYEVLFICQQIVARQA